METFKSKQDFKINSPMNRERRTGVMWYLSSFQLEDGRQPSEIIIKPKDIKAGITLSKSLWGR